MKQSYKGCIETSQHVLLQVGCNLKACLGFLDRIPSITHLASMRDVLVEGAVAMLHVIPRATDGSLPEEYIVSVVSQCTNLPCNLILSQPYI